MIRCVFKMVPIEEDCVRLIEQRYQEDLIRLKMKLCKAEEIMKKQDVLHNYYNLKGVEQK